MGCFSAPCFARSSDFAVPQVETGPYWGLVNRFTHRVTRFSERHEVSRMPEIASQLSPKTPRPNSGTLAAVVRSHGAVLFRRAMSLTHRHADACDLVQDA